MLSVCLLDWIASSTARAISPIYENLQAKVTLSSKSRISPPIGIRPSLFLANLLAQDELVVKSAGTVMEVTIVGLILANVSRNDHCVEVDTSK
ncbi:hypothetical protein EDD37DRAFT_75553 [Exophiala viscosa]|uniref:uncharacterized protein n=1 Tax=Exophiala viscosa TaxID=2486360 RepID=UPI00218E1597|nr:hypothetical protein EDD37DRAFT_75553 [Exophiala viscosa]